jgi:hypothetical protein
MNIPNYYGLEPVSTDPVLAAPTQYPNGGVIYFDSGWKWEIIEAALSLIAVRFNEREFGIFQGEAREPIRDRYLDQVRIASKDALIELFRVGTGIRQIPDQPIPIGAYIQQFFREQGRSGIIQTSAELPVGTATGPRKGSHSDSSWKTSIGASTACGAVRGYLPSDKDYPRSAADAARARRRCDRIGKLFAAIAHGRFWPKRRIAFLMKCLHLEEADGWPPR